MAYIDMGPTILESVVYPYDPDTTKCKNPAHSFMHPQWVIIQNHWAEHVSEKLCTAAILKGV
jgi:hypothetical protein